MQMSPEGSDAPGLVALQPAIHRIRVAGTEQSSACHGMGTQPIGDLQQGGTAFPHLRMGIVIANRLQALPLLAAQDEGSALDHGRPPNYEVVLYHAITHLHSQK
jgi:hypothetical protein